MDCLRVLDLSDTLPISSAHCLLTIRVITMTDWQPVLQNFSGIIIDKPSHLAPGVAFKEANIDHLNSICPLTNLSFLSVQGIDAEKFLQGQLTCDIREITQHTTRLSGHCNPKGRLHGIFHVIQLETNHYCLVLPQVQLMHVMNSLKKYAVFSKVKIDILPIYSFGIISTQSHINQIHHELLNLNDFDKCDISEHKLSYIKLPSHDKTILRFLVICTADDAAEKLNHYWQNLNKIGFNFANTIFWHKLNIMALLPTIYPETTEKCLPHYLNLPQLHAVNFKKGCYTGQEIIARMEYLGNIKKTITHREFELIGSETPALGEPLSTDKSDQILLDYVPIESINNHAHFLGLFITDL